MLKSVERRATVPAMRVSELTLELLDEGETSSSKRKCKFGDEYIRNNKVVIFRTDVLSISGSGLGKELGDPSNCSTSSSEELEPGAPKRGWYRPRLFVGSLNILHITSDLQSSAVALDL